MNLHMVCLQAYFKNQHVNNVKNLMGSFKDFHFFVEMECMLHSNEKIMTESFLRNYFFTNKISVFM